MSFVRSTEPCISTYISFMHPRAQTCCLCLSLRLAVPPTSITMEPTKTSVNLSWVPEDRRRNHGFHIHYQLANCKETRNRIGKQDVKHAGVVLLITRGHEKWIVTDMRSWMEASRVSFLCKVAGLSLSFVFQGRAACLRCPMCICLWRLSGDVPIGRNPVGTEV